MMDRRDLLKALLNRPLVPDGLISPQPFQQDHVSNQALEENQILASNPYFRSPP
jgi:hypothetical protein